MPLRQGRQYWKDYFRYYSHLTSTRKEVLMEGPPHTAPKSLQRAPANKFNNGDIQRMVQSNFIWSLLRSRFDFL
jgi:hypothetical protein